MTFKTVSKIRTSLKKNWNIHLTSSGVCTTHPSMSVSLFSRNTMAYAVYRPLMWVVTHIPSHCSPTHHSLLPMALHIHVASIHCPTIHFLPISLELTLLLSVPQLQWTCLPRSPPTASAHTNLTILRPALLITSFSLKILYIGLPGHFTLLIFLLPLLATL